MLISLLKLEGILLSTILLKQFPHVLLHIAYCNNQSSTPFLFHFNSDWRGTPSHTDNPLAATLTDCVVVFPLSEILQLSVSDTVSFMVFHSELPKAFLLLLNGVFRAHPEQEDAGQGSQKDMLDSPSWSDTNCRNGAHLPWLLWRVLTTSVLFHFLQ